jgi:hypothetical protein
LTWPDRTNGAFEFFGSLAVWANVRALYHDRQVKGVRVGVFVFFAAWGVWNLYYYRHLDQLLSWYGGMSLVLANFVWVVLAIRYHGR